MKYIVNHWVCNTRLVSKLLVAKNVCTIYICLHHSYMVWVYIKEDLKEICWLEKNIFDALPSKFNNKVV